MYIIAEKHVNEFFVIGDYSEIYKSIDEAKAAALEVLNLYSGINEIVICCVTPSTVAYIPERVEFYAWEADVQGD